MSANKTDVELVLMIHKESAWNYIYLHCTLILVFQQFFHGLKSSTSFITLTERTFLQKTGFCLLEVRAMVVAVQQPSAERTAILTMCIV